MFKYFVFSMYKSVLNCGLYYKNITIINDASRVVSERCHNLEHHSRVFTLNCDDYSIGVTYDNHQLMMIVCLFILVCVTLVLAQFSQNRTEHIRQLCRQTIVLSCHRCLINTGVEKINNNQMYIRILTTRFH